MNRTILLPLAAVLLVLGFLGAPLGWGEEGILPNLVTRIGSWIAASAGVLLLWIALPSGDAPVRGSAVPVRVPSGPVRAA